jgi:hypothetical protein
MIISGVGTQQRISPMHLAVMPRRAANMSVIQETQAGDEIIVIQEFNASPEGEGFSWDTSHKFRVGDHV